MKMSVWLTNGVQTNVQLLDNSFIRGGRVRRAPCHWRASLRRRLARGAYESSNLDREPPERFPPRDSTDPHDGRRSDRRTGGDDYDRYQEPLSLSVDGGGPGDAVRRRGRTRGLCLVRARPYRPPRRM